MSTSAKKRTVYLAYYLFFVLGIALGNVVSASISLSVGVLSIASVLTALAIVNTYRHSTCLLRENADEHSLHKRGSHYYAPLKASAS